VIGTVQLLRFLSDPQLRRRTTAETNKVESCNRFSDWRRFGNHGVIAANDPDEHVTFGGKWHGIFAAIWRLLRSLA
jgi:TnpA family transposase